MIGRNGLRVHPSFWQELAAGGTRQRPSLSADLLARWVSLLLATVPQGPDTYLLLPLGERCAEAGLKDALLDVFDAMATGDSRLNRGSPWMSEDNDEQAVRVGLVRQHRPVRQFSLESLYEAHLKPNVEDMAESLLSGWFAAWRSVTARSVPGSRLRVIATR